MESIELKFRYKESIIGLDRRSKNQNKMTTDNIEGSEIKTQGQSCKWAD